MKHLLLQLVVSAALSACSVPIDTEQATLIEDVAVALDAEMPGVRVVSWTKLPGTLISIELSTNPDALIGEGTVIAENLTTDQYSYSGGEVDGRLYFTVIPKQGKPVKTALRVLPLQGGRNFRDLGGYSTVDGRTVKWGEVFRSGVMDGLTSADYQYLSGLGIITICDFRDAEEREHEPTNWRAGDINYVTWDEEDNNGTEPISAAIRAPDATPEDVFQGMIAYYRQIAYEHQDHFAAMFDLLAKGKSPLAFNCSAGKDRTGAAAALLLTSLGVSRDVVVADYALSDQIVNYDHEYGIGEQQSDADGGQTPYEFMRQVSPELVRPLLRSDPQYIEAMLKQLEEEYGSVLAFIQTGLGVDDDELAAIQTRLLE